MASGAAAAGSGAPLPSPSMGGWGWELTGDGIAQEAGRLPHLFCPGAWPTPTQPSPIEGEGF